MKPEATNEGKLQAKVQLGFDDELTQAREQTVRGVGKAS